MSIPTRGRRSSPIAPARVPSSPGRARDLSTPLGKGRPLTDAERAKIRAEVDAASDQLERKKNSQRQARRRREQRELHPR